MTHLAHRHVDVALLVTLVRLTFSRVLVCVCVCVYVWCQYKLLHSNKLSQLSNFVSSPRVHCVTILYSSYETSNINIVMKFLN